MHAYSQFYSSPFYFPFAPGLLALILPLIAVVVLWVIVLKGYALWHAARAGQKYWFIALLVVNTLGILEIIYLLWYRPKNSPHHSAPVSSSSPA